VEIKFFFMGLSLIFFCRKMAPSTNINIFFKGTNAYAKFHKTPFIGKSLINLNTK
jgi:hypothetical protein